MADRPSPPSSLSPELEALLYRIVDARAELKACNKVLRQCQGKKRGNKAGSTKAYIEESKQQRDECHDRLVALETTAKSSIEDIEALIKTLPSRDDEASSDPNGPPAPAIVNKSGADAGPTEERGASKQDATRVEKKLQAPPGSENPLRRSTRFTAATSHDSNQSAARSLDASSPKNNGPPSSPLTTPPGSPQPPRPIPSRSPRSPDRSYAQAASSRGAQVAIQPPVPRLDERNAKRPRSSDGEAQGSSPAPPLAKRPCATKPQQPSKWVDISSDSDDIQPNGGLKPSAAKADGINRAPKDGAKKGEKRLKERADDAMDIDEENPDSDSEDEEEKEERKEKRKRLVQEEKERKRAKKEQERLEKQQKREKAEQDAAELEERLEKSRLAREAENVKMKKGKEREQDEVGRKKTSLASTSTAGLSKSKGFTSSWAAINMRRSIKEESDDEVKEEGEEAYKGHVNKFRILWKSPDAEERLDALEVYRKYEKYHKLLLQPLDLSKVTEEEFIEYETGGSLAIEVFALAKDAVQQVPLPSNFRRALRDIQELLPAAATTSRELTRHILRTSKNNVRCMYHWPRKRSKAKVIKHKVTGMSRHPAAYQCGCDEDVACFEFMIYKSWYAKQGRNVELVSLFEPRIREFIFQNIFRLALLNLDDLFNETGSGWDDESFALIMSRKQRDGAQGRMDEAKASLTEQGVEFYDSDEEKGGCAN